LREFYLTLFQIVSYQNGERKTRQNKTSKEKEN